MKLEIKETDINKAKSWSESVYLDDDLLLTEHINKAPMPTEPRKMNFILIGLCMKGQIEYRLDTQEININPGDMLIVSDKHIVDKYKPSPDMEGLCMILSVNFFHEIIKNVRDVNSLFIFSRSHPVIGLTTKEQETFKEYFHVIKHKIGDQDNFFRKDLIRTLLLAMFYDVGNIIYRFKETDKPQTRAEAILTKYIRTAMLEELGEDYVRTARGKGAGETWILYLHVLKNAIVAVVPLIGMIVASVLSGSIIIEQVYGIPGMGKLLIGAVTSRDFPLTQTLVIYITVLIVVTNFLVDIAIQLIDPRIRLSGRN